MLAAMPQTASAQTVTPPGGQVALYAPKVDAFPIISVDMGVTDATGLWVSGLQTTQLAVTEDGAAAKVTALEEKLLPLQLTVAINSGPIMASLDRGAQTRYQLIAAALGSWARSRPPQPVDDMSLVTIGGTAISHSSAADWAVALAAYKEDFRKSKPNLLTLQAAVQTVAEATVDPASKRAVLFVTQHMDEGGLNELLSPIAASAKQANVRIFVWFTDLPQYASSPSAAAFSLMAAGTGGAFFADTGLAPIPDLETLFAPLRRVYSLSYRSGIATPGNHELLVSVQGSAGAVRSAPIQFPLDVQPPNPMLVSPPLDVVRAPPADDPYNEKVLVPDTQQIEMMVEFPDGRTRGLARTTLYVDDAIAAENTSAPFERFNWDLQTYLTTGDHKLSVEAVDEYGLSRKSLDVPVTVHVVPPPSGFRAFFTHYQSYILTGSIALAALGLLAALLFSPLRKRLFAVRTTRGAHTDPLTQPIPQGLPRSADAVPVPAVLAPTIGGDVHAWLRPLIVDDASGPYRPSGGAIIPIGAKPVTLGTDPAKASTVLDDPSLDPLHTTITCDQEGVYWITDAGTIAGTWVNYEPVTAGGQVLHKGDLVHIGRLFFRFELPDMGA